MEAGVPRIEVDLQFMGDDSMLVFHDPTLDDVTSGYGRVAAMERGDIAGIRYNSGQREGICFLEDVVDRVAGTGTMLQVDLKLMTPISESRANDLVAALAPMGYNIVVGSQAHWNLRRLRGVPVAFDPTLHWHYAPDGRGQAVPRALGVHGLWDDSPLARSRQVGPLEYLDARVLDLRSLVPEAVEWMVDIPTIRHLGALGMSLGERLAADGCALAAWTLSEATPERRLCLEHLYALGTETVITDIPLRAASDWE